MGQGREGLLGFCGVGCWGMLCRCPCNRGAVGLVRKLESGNVRDGRVMLAFM